MADSVATRYSVGTNLGSKGFNSADPSTWGLTPLQFAQNTAAANPNLHMTPDQVQQLADQTQAQWTSPDHQAGTAVGTPSLDLGANAGSQSINNVNTWMRQQPWYQQLTSSWGQTGNFSDQQKAQLAQAAQANGVNLTNKNIQLDANGNFQDTSSGWKTAGKIASMAAPIVAAPFTGGATLALIGAGSGALGGALSGGGVKGALLGGALGALPGVGSSLTKGASGLVEKGLVNAGTGAASGALRGGGVQGALTGAGLGALGTAAGGASQLANPLGQDLTKAGLGAAQGALTGGGQGALQGGIQGGLSGASNVFNSMLPPGSAGGGGMPVNWGNLINAGLGAAQGASNGGGWTGAAVGAGQGFLRPTTGQPQQGGQQQPRPGGTVPTYAQSLVNGGQGDYSNPYGTTNTGGLFGSPGGGQNYSFGFASPGANPIPGTGPVDATSDSGGDNSSEGQDPSYGNTLPSTTPDWSGGGVWSGGTGGTYNPISMPGGGSPQLPSYGAPGSAGSGGNAPNAPNGGSAQGGFLGKWGPLLTQVGGLAGGMLAARQAQNSAMQRSPEEQAALAGAQQVQQQTGQNAQQLYGQGQSYLQPAANYYQALLSGNRALQSQAVAPQIAAATDAFRGAQAGLQQQGLRGAQMQQAQGNLARQRYQTIAGLTTGVQPAAAAALGQMGQNVLQQAPGYYQLAGGLGTNLLGQGQYNRMYAGQQGTAAGQAIGSAVRDIGNAFPGVQQPYRGVTPPPAGQSGTSSQAMTNPMLPPQSNQTLNMGGNQKQNQGGFTQPIA